MTADGSDDWIRALEYERNAGPDRGIRSAAGRPAARAGPARRAAFPGREDADGAGLIAGTDAVGDFAYASTVRLFVGEERNHARLLALPLAAGGRPRSVGTGATGPSGRCADGWSYWFRRSRK
ncbi:hypothetical protein ACFPN0_27205 [Kitasatospora cinereorecta]